MSGAAVSGAAAPGVSGLLRRLLADDPGRPRLTWYGPGGERVELSARVLDNWVAKTANLLVDELDAGPGSRIGVQLPAGWRCAVWLLAIWSAGGCAVLDPKPAPDGAAAGPAELGTDRPASAPAAPNPLGRLDVLVTHAPMAAVPTDAADSPRLVAVALPALSPAFPEPLPPGVLDAAAEVRGYGDVFVPLAEPAEHDPALVLPSPAGAAETLTHGELLPAAAAAAEAARMPEGVRLLTDADPTGAVPALLAPWSRLGSVVWHWSPPPVTGDAELRATERITLRWPTSRP